MCGRYGIIHSSKAYADLYGAEIEEWLDEPKWQAAPEQKLPVLTEDKKVKLYRWGFKPAWIKPGMKSYSMINARAESILEKPTYRNAIKNKRVAVLADSFYEWKDTKEGKIPYRIRLKSDEPFAFAGVSQESDDGERFTIITTEPNDLMAPIHNRMPVMLNKQEVEEYLDPKAEPDQVMSLLRTYPDDEMEAYAVSKLVNSPRNNSPEIIKPV